jgi:hypothetical protein
MELEVVCSSGASSRWPDRQTGLTKTTVAYIATVSPMASVESGLAPLLL